MNLIVKVVTAVSIVALGLWWSVATFLGSSEDLAASLNLRNLAHLRSDSADSGEAKKSPPALAEATPEENLVSANAAKPQANPPAALPPKTSTDEIVGTLAVGEQPLISETLENKPQLAASEIGAAQAPGESKAAAKERKLMERLGVRKPKPPTIAADVKLELSPDCDAGPDTMAPVAVKFRHNSPTIRGESLHALDLLLTEFRQCDTSLFQISSNPLAKADTTPSLMQMRYDELKYYFLQHSVSKSALRFPADQ